VKKVISNFCAETVKMSSAALIISHWLAQDVRVGRKKSECAACVASSMTPWYRTFPEQAGNGAADRIIHDFYELALQAMCCGGALGA